ncbi:hypothetical protein DFJ58DRAFT_745569 [Suillus subalutaceus]|uniref:uncharacterized protein n=1 Tax=Suillus subalutaceus TaxID=48586 RepID=UPI001B86D6BD|nr:uncharacterized protein DFJ58DRAFT_745569 [Suillus subalutaceus]KAG1854940.1 hypothetical protein DFJ58DRAFT_745569 [Suillus subalutaceus]
MAPFSSSLLALSPTPEPDMCPVSPAKEAGTPVQEVPETEQQKVLRSWVALLQALDTQVKIIPGDGPELFEGRESWMCGWSQLSSEVEKKEVPIRAIKALPSCAVKADKGKGKGKGSVPSVPTNGTDEVESEVEHLRAENEHLKNIIRSMHQSGRSPQSRLIVLSNQTYTMSTELGLSCGPGAKAPLE